VVELLSPRLTPLPSRQRLEEKVVSDHVNFTLTLCAPRTERRIGLLCANSPINYTDPSGLISGAHIDDDPQSIFNNLINQNPDQPSSSSSCVDSPPTSPYPEPDDDEGLQDAPWALVPLTLAAMAGAAALTELADALGLGGTTSATGTGASTVTAGDAIPAAVRNAMYNGGIENVPMAEREAAAEYYEQVAQTAKTPAIRAFNLARANYARNGGTPPGGITNFKP